MPGEPDYAALRAAMVEHQLRDREIHDERVLAAMAAVPRELFVPERRRRHAYDDGAQPIGHDQTISQPWVVAAICQALALTGEETVLEVGTGSGYSAAVLARLARHVVSVERIPELAQRAATVLARLEAANVEVLVADGSAGLPDRGPFDAIAVHATAPAPPPGLLESLAEGGRLVVPISRDGLDMLTRYERRPGGTLRTTDIAPCRFVPLVGEQGF